MTRQESLVETFKLAVVDLRDIAPLIRIGCRASSYDRLLSRQKPD